MRTCTKCSSEKQDTEFYASQNSNWCKQCVRATSSQWSRLNKAKKNAQNKRWRNKNKGRRKTITDAGNALWRAIKSGSITRGTSCEACGSQLRIEAAHFDYSKPLDVKWLCQKCHRAWDSQHPKSNPVVSLNEITESASLKSSN